MKATFFNLDPVKRGRFLDACSEEFAQHGFESASTNRIVERLGIAKGSFFKYTESKEDVYLYLVETTLEELGRIQASPATFSSPDLLVRAEELLRGHADYARREPARYRLVLRAYLATHSPVYPRLVEVRVRVSSRSVNSIYEGVDWSLYRLEREEVIALLELLDLGVRQGALEALDEKADAANLLSYIARAFDLARRALRGGIYSRDVGRDRG